MKKVKTITLNNNLLEWIEKMIEKKEFASVSHCIEKAVFLLKESYEKKVE